MKTSIIYILLSFLSGTTLFSSCSNNDDGPAVTTGYSFSILYPGNFKDINASGATITLTNAVTGVSASQESDASGLASFSSLLPGNYNISVSKNLSSAEALAQTGREGELFLSASLSNYAIPAEGGSYEIQLAGSNTGGFVLKEIYFSGAPASGSYSNDQFYEIYNNSSSTLYADSLCIGDVVGSPYLSASSKPSGFKSDDKNVYFINLMMITGDGRTYPVEPGKSILIARSAINHHSDPSGNPQSPVDLGTGVADFEVYREESGRDTDNPDVPNLKILYFATATLFDWIPYVFGPSIVIFKHPDPAGLPYIVEPGANTTRTYPQLPVSYVIDAVDCISKGAPAEFKRLPVSLDAGYQSASNSYSGESIRRKVKTTVNDRKLLQDTNNSSNDFELISPPTPKGW
ncbi:Protein of unknown function [bacterium A37T11]|nr:Protein of unknown function [bacterium A37T11]